MAEKTPTTTSRLKPERVQQKLKSERVQGPLRPERVQARMKPERIQAGLKELPGWELAGDGRRWRGPTSSRRSVRLWPSSPWSPRSARSRATCPTSTCATSR